MRAKLSKAVVARAKPNGKRQFVFDLSCPGLVLSVTESGYKSYMLLARFPGGANSVRRLLGKVGAMSLDDARAEARRWLALLREGRDPQLELAERQHRAAQEQAATFGRVVEAYFEHRLRGRRAARSRREIEEELLPAWRDRPVASIGRGDVIQLLDCIKARAERRASRYGRSASFAHARIIFAHIRLIFAHAEVRFELTASPCSKLRPKDLGLVSAPRQRVLCDREIGAFWRATEQMGAPFGPFLRLLLLTGCRRNEISNLAWSEVERGLIVIPAARFKSACEHHVPITAAVRELLDGLPRFKSGDFVFSTCHGRRPVSGFSKAMARLIKLMRAELPDLPAFALHDLRRTCRSKLSECGVDQTVAERCIGHSAKGLIAVYDRHSYRNEIAAAFEKS
jgi:integrase